MNRRAVPWWGWAALAVAIAMSIAAYPQLPARVVTHFGANGKPNGYMPPLEAVAWAPALMAAMLIAWPFIWRIDPRRKSYDQFFPTYRFLGGAVVVFVLFSHGFILATALGILVPLHIITAAVGLLIALLSNLLPRVKSNWFIGVRTPWTLSSETVWEKTHRFAGHTGVAAGLAIIALAWLLPQGTASTVLIAVIGGWALVITAASYVLFRQEQRG